MPENSAALKQSLKQFGETVLEASVTGKHPTFTLVVKIEKGVGREKVTALGKNQNHKF